MSTISAYRRTVIVALVMVLSSAATSAQERWIGQKFMPRENIEAKIAQQTIPLEDLSLPLVVEKVQGKWLWVGNAWVRKQHVVPLRDAAIYYTEFMRRGGNQETGYTLRGLVWMEQGELVNAEKDFTEAIRQNPGSATAYYARGRVRQMEGDYAGTAKDYESSILIDSENIEVWNAMGWLLATCPDPNFRNGSFAVICAKKAGDLSDWKQPAVFDTLAAAYAEAGDFEQAIHWQQKTVASISKELKDQTRARLALYQAGRPYRQGVRQPPAAGNTPMPPPVAKNTPMPRPNIPENTDQKKPVINVADGRLTINGTKLSLPCKTSELIELLGQPTRVKGLVRVWDQDGVTAVQPKESDRINKITIALGKDLVGSLLGTAAKKSFQGTLTINGAPISATSTIEEVNHTRKTNPFRKSKKRYVATHGNVRLILEPADAYLNRIGVSFASLIIEVK